MLKHLLGIIRDRCGTKHRFNDSSTSECEPPAKRIRTDTKNTEIPSQHVSDASKAAGQAAMARMQQIQQPS